jgi:glycosyltransferase involved in cell wall biosynthesis
MTLCDAMKILLGVDKLLYGYGASRITLEMAEYLLNNGYNIKILCGKSNVKTDVPIILCKYSDLRFESSILDASRIIKQERPDIFHSHSYPMHVCGSIAKSSRIKHVMHYHGVWYVSLWSTPKMALSASRTHIGDLIASHFSDKVITISNFLKNELISKLKVNKDKIEVIYNSVDSERFNLNLKDNPVREKYNISKEDIVLLCVSTLAKQKGQQHLIDCMQKVVKELPSAKLLLVGRIGAENPRYKDSLLDKIHKYNLDSNIILTGFIEDEDLPKYYAASDIFVWATMWEGFGLPFTEAMASGKPVIGYSVSVMPELIANGLNGYLVNPMDTDKMVNQIISLSKNPGQRVEMGMNGRNFVEQNFNFSRNMENIKDIYRNLIK